MVTGNSKAWLGGFGEIANFQSVSDGKALVASAITDKGVQTASDATFQTMAGNIDKISSIPNGFCKEIIVIHEFVSTNTSSSNVSYTCTSYVNAAGITPKAGDFIFSWPTDVSFLNDGYNIRLNASVAWIHINGSYRTLQWSGQYRSDVNSYDYPWCPVFFIGNYKLTYRIYYGVS